MASRTNTMDIRALKCFILAAELGSVTHAAGELGIVQSALSRKIQMIEQELGCTLFTRLPRGIQLTPAGRRFLDRARRIVREVEFARTDLKDGAGDVEGEVTLGLSPTLAPMLAPDCLAQVGADFPGIQLKIVEGFSSTLLDLLLTGRIDLAVLTNPPRTAMLQQEPAVSEEILVVTPPGARGIQPSFSLDDLCNEPVVVTSGLRIVIEDQLRKHGRRLEVAAEVDSVEAIRRMVLRGQAITLMPASTFQQDVNGRRLDAFHVANVNLHRMLVIAQPLSGRDTPAIRQVAEALARQFSSLSDEGVFRLPQRQPRKAAAPKAPRSRS
ncbi:LysR family transcriptional regulator [Caenimonas terrae]|uniref:LysR family transcriptional regulator n=1 Tax=Caenimonas terrae TaxID=696074 RepID=A0ABW0N8I3_9BURK